ncbi:MAG: nickel pincer cofactor biosynthesis protein LarC [Methanophagales archaeon]|nr:nickel pincer cofactor biosynthesis protein LarC [Methanophagales archaeon]
MTKALIFEPFSGASGDMVIASLLDLGVDESEIADGIAAFNLRMEVEEVERGGIVAKKVRFIGGLGGAEERSYPEIVRIIRDSGLDSEIINNSLRIFERIADAEARVHGEDKQHLRFHELGAMDTIGDLVGSSIAFSSIHPDIVISTPISVGRGYVKTEHGLMPVPAPATLEILRRTDLLFQGGVSHSELLTPTGAAILGHFVHRSVASLPPLRITETGYGAGSRDLSVPNVLRASLGEPAMELATDKVGVLETNVDNVTGEILGNLIEVLMTEGARDVTIIPTLMKKGRAGHLIRVITAPEDVQRMAYLLMRETGTLGVREMEVRMRYIASREKEKMKVKIRGKEREVGVKIGRSADGEVLNIAAEFEDAKRVASELKMPVKDVIKIVEGEARKNFFL